MRSTGIVSLAQAITGIAFFIYTLVVARMLSVADFGLFQALLAVFGMLQVVAIPLLLGTLHSVGRAKVSHRAVVIKAFLKKGFIIIMICETLLILVSPWIYQALDVPSLSILLCLGLMVVGRGLIPVFYGALQGVRDFKRFSVLRCAEGFLVLGAGCFALSFGLGVSGALLGYGIAFAVLTLYFLISIGLPSLRSSRKNKSAPLSDAKIVMAVSSLVLLIDNIPMIVSRAMHSPEMSGSFGVLYNLRNMLWPFAYAVAYPFYSHLLLPKTTKGLLPKALLLVSLLGGGFILMAFLFAEPIIHLFYTDKFSGAAGLMSLYGVSLLTQMMAMVLLYHESALKKVNAWMLIFVAVIYLLSLIGWGQTSRGLMMGQIFASMTAICICGRNLLTRSYLLKLK